MAKLTINRALKQALDAHKAGQIQKAHRLYAAILKAQPKHPDANYNTGLLTVGFGKIELALPFFKTALEANPSNAQFWYSHIVLLIKLERLIDAKVMLNQAKSKGIKGADFNQLEQRLNDAIKASKVQDPPQNQQQSLINLYTKGQLQQALEQTKTLLQQFPSSSVLHNICGAIYVGLGQLDDSVKAYNKALAFKPDYAGAYYNMGIALQVQGKLEEAIKAYNKAISIKPDYADAYNNMGNALKERGKLDDAIASYNKALYHKPDYADTYYNMGNVLKDQGKLDEAIVFYNKALGIKPDYAGAYYNMGNTLKDQGKLEEAIEAYNKALGIKPDYAGAYYNMGNTLKDQGKLEEAIEAYNKALAIKPDYAAAYNNMGVALQEQGKMEVAIKAYNKALTIKTDYADAYNNMGNALQAQGKLKEAIKAYNKALAINPDYADAYYNMGIILQEQSKLEEAIKAYNKALAINPDYADAYYNMGNVHKDQGKLEEAIEAYNKALAINPDYADAYYNMGIMLQERGKLDDAIASYNKALYHKPDYADTYYNMGNVHKDQGKLDEAIVFYNKALAFKPDYAGAYYNMGIALQVQGKLEEAIKAYNKALSIKPDYAAAHNNMGIALQEQGKLKEAIVFYNKALTIKPDYAEAYYNMGVALQEQGKMEVAIEAYNKALYIKPDNADAYNNIGIALKSQGKLEEAIEAYNKALAIKPSYEAARVGNLFQKAHICNWDNIAKDIKLIPELGISEKYVAPFALLPLEDAPDRHLIRSKIYAKAKYPQKPLPPKVKPSIRPKRIRIGYFSADFREHPVAYLIAKFLEQHNRDQFEVFGYSLHGSSSCKMRQRLKKSFDCFTDVQDMNDRDIALQARQDEIDIAIDLNGYTKNSRTGVFAYRAAPIQISYLGYPGSMGAEFIDYIVADQHLIPPENQKYFSEKKIYLPDVYVPTDNTLPFSNEPPSRFDLGLPDSSFVFCVITNSYKVNQRVFDIWMRLLKSIDGSVLWLLETNKIVKANLEKEANKRGVTSDRLVFAKNVSHEKYLSQFHQADLFLDTFPYGAGATASDALWAGLPIITKTGQSYSSRMAGSMLNAVGLPELITETEEDYEALILKLATNPTKLAKIKEKLATNRLTQPLFNTELYTRHLENGYQQAYQNYFDGNLPQTIMVPK